MAIQIVPVIDTEGEWLVAECVEDRLFHQRFLVRRDFKRDDNLMAFLGEVETAFKAMGLDFLYCDKIDSV